MKGLSAVLRSCRAPSLLAGVVVLPGCAGGGSSLSVRTDSAGVEIVRFPGPDRPLPNFLTEDFRLGGSETKSEESFFEVYSGMVGVDAESNLYVLDRPAARVLVFDARGEFVRSMGRPGGGPGEIGMAAGLVVEPDGTTGVVDFAKRGLVRFDARGEPLPLEPTPSAYFGGVIVRADGVLITQVQAPADNDAPAEVLLRIAGEDTTRVAVLRRGEMKPIQLASCGMSFSGMPPIFAPSLRWAASRGRIAAVTGVAYDIALFEDAREVRRIRRDREPLPATEELALRELGEAMQVRTEGGIRRCESGEVVRQRGFAEKMPAIGRVALSPDGWLWLEHGGVREDPKPIDLFSPDGEYAGTLEAGVPFPVAFLPDGRLAAAEKDELDVMRLVIYRLSEAM